MNHSTTINELSRNREIFKELFTGLTEEEYIWKQQPEKWCLLEIVCHLHDEEREDFRARTKQVLENPSEPFPAIDPQGWVKSRNYIQQNYSEMLDKFLEERQQSVVWLQSLVAPKWDSAYIHPKFGPLSAKMLLSNWVAHDYLHVRQIVKLKYDNLKRLSDETLKYAGDW